MRTKAPRRERAKRARSVAHVEYEILDWIGRRAWLDDLKLSMTPWKNGQADKIAEKRFRKGAENICRYLENMMERRRHKLPKDHEDYKERE
tara:strand:+ start:102 stop:374 length:273 start_codon:yes stop_codon:yes gene_type:complete